MPEISPYATVKSGAKLAADVKVGPFSCIGESVTIDAGCIVENNVTILGQTCIGAGTHIFPMSMIGTSSEAGRSTAGNGQCLIGQGNSIREHVTIHTAPGKTTRIGNGNLIMIDSIIEPGATIADDGIFANFTHVNDDAAIEDYVRTSAYTVVAPGVTVGAYTFTVGYSLIDRDAPPFAMVQGAPFRVRGLNMENLRRCGFSAADIQALKLAFRRLFNGAEECVNSGILTDLLADSNEHVRRLAQAVTHSEAGRQLR